MEKTELWFENLADQKSAVEQPVSFLAARFRQQDAAVASCQI